MTLNGQAVTRPLVITDLLRKAVRPTCSTMRGKYIKPLTTTTGCTGVGPGKLYNCGKHIRSLTKATAMPTQTRTDHRSVVCDTNNRAQARSDVHNTKKQPDVSCCLYRVEAYCFHTFQLFEELTHSTLTHIKGCVFAMSFCSLQHKW